MVNHMSYLKAIKQDILSSANNSSTANLASGATFTGVSEETLGVNGIQVYHFADQDCTIYLDQSLDATNWDVVDEFECLADNACTRTFISVAPYFRLRVTNDGLATTTELRVAAGMTPIINPLPRALSEDGRLKVETTLTGQQNSGRHAWITPGNALTAISPVRLAGTNFDGTNKDPNFWTETTDGTGAVTQSGEIELTTGTTADSSASYETVRRARFVVGSALKFQAISKLVNSEDDNIARIGAYDTTDGFFFQNDNGVYSVGTRNNSVDVLVNSGSFNGNYGPSYAIDNGYHKKEIEWTPRAVFFYIDGKLLHSLNAGHYSRFLTLPARMDLINYNGSVIDVTYDILALAIIRLGKLDTNPTYKYIGTNSTTVLKYGAGVLHRIILTDDTGEVDVYDNTAGTGTIMAVIDVAKSSIGTLEFGAPFSDGLTIVVSGGAKITVIYE